MDDDTKKILHKVANTIRALTMDAIQKANSGHPGLPMGCAEIGAYLYGHLLRQNPKNPQWWNRDRFLLSAGHGSMLLYSCLHLSGYDISLDDIKDFRQLNSRTPGHPEAPETVGVEATSGPLGQGVGSAVGQALGLKMLAARFNTPVHTLFDSKVYCLAGDGCIMEGISSEASSLAGHLGLDNLVLIYDSNNICLDGPLSEACTEDTIARYKAYGWDVYEVDGHNFDEIHEAFSKISKEQTRPTMVVAHTVIGKGAPHKAGTHKVHGAPLGDDEIKAAKELLGLPEEPFFVPQAVKGFFESKLKQDRELEDHWCGTFEAWKVANGDRWQECEAMVEKQLPANLESKLKELQIASPVAGRKASHAVIGYLGDGLPQLIGGSADLSGSDLTMMKQWPVVSSSDFSGRNIKFGVREFAMGAMATGLSQTGMFTPFVGTFLVFSDYMRNAIRLAAMQKRQVIYQFTHDSIFLGEDGPTHQPVEQLASLRAIPNLHVIRPADTHEVRQAWLAALNYEGPTALILSRQSLPDIDGTDVAYKDGVGRGAYIVKREKERLDYTLMATGSELSLAMDVAQELQRHGKGVRVVSMPCWELFEQQDFEYKKSVLGDDIGKCVSIEAGVELGWHKWVGKDGVVIALESFGASAPAKCLAEEFGFTVDAILERIL